MRETLFNWLQPVIDGAVCLDLYAGTGVLGLEALSRGASRVTLVEHDAHAVAQLRRNIETLQTDMADLYDADSMLWLEQVWQHVAKPFDVVFLDPPFGQDLATRSCDLLLARDCLLPGALIYLEAGSDVPLPSGLEVLREKKAGQVHYRLLKYGE